MKIITAPHPVLRQQAQEVTVFDKKFFQFLKDLEKTLLTEKEPQGVGLAAPQVNKSWQIFAAILSAKKQQTTFFVNPKITAHSAEKILGLMNGDERFEGCLSVPKIYGPIPRYNWIEIEYLTPDWKNLNSDKTVKVVKKTEKFTDFDARIIQHEYDHLKGILFLDHSQRENLPIFTEGDDSWLEIKNRDEVFKIFVQ